MRMVSDLVKALDEDALLFKLGFAKTNYNGIVVYYNSDLKEHFFESRNRKSKLVIHHTAGGLEGDLLTLLKPEKISVPFVISSKGKIIMLFKPWNWAWHLGKTALGGNEEQSKLSIGIELSNWGFLIRRRDFLYTYLGKVYCRIDQTDLYTQTEPWRSFGRERIQYFCNYSDKQYESLKILKDLLCRLYGIPNELFPEIDKYSPKVIEFKGITTHINFRTNKYDLSPNFQWNKIM